MKQKKQLATTLILATIGSYLFYKSYAGINYPIFTIISILFLLHSHKDANIKKTIIGCIPVLSASLFILIYPQLLTKVIWFLSYIIMWSSIVQSPYSIVTLLQGVSSLFLSPFVITHKKSDTNKVQAKKNQGTVFVFTGIIVIIFAALYIKSNPVIGNLLSQIDFSFIEFGFVMMIGGLSFVLYGLIRITPNKHIRVLNFKPMHISRTEISENDEQEFKIAKLSIWIISIVLLIANSADLIVIFTGKLPSGVSYSQYVHQGFNTLIFTLSLAIALVIYFYRGQLNFHKKISVLKKASVFWIIQNLLLACITAYKNYLYVETYGLTYKRIAVFLGLICVIIGLVLTINKLKKPYTNWFFINKLNIYAYASCFLISLIPVDYVISHYNLNYAKEVDLYYISHLSKPNLNAIDEYLDKNTQHDINYIDILKGQKEEIIIRALNKKWQGWNYYSYKITSEN